MKVLFLAFSSVASRSKRLSEKLGSELVYYKDRFPYVFSLFFSSIKILRINPDWLIIQATQGFIVFIFSILKKFLKFKLIADLHTGLIVNTGIKSKILNLSFINYLKYFDLILIHNELIKKIIPVSIKHRSLLVYDPLLNDCESLYLKKEKLLVFTTVMLKPDEMLDDLIEAAKHLKDEALFICTGKKVKLKGIKSLGYLKYNDYLRIMKTADIVIAMTKREYTSLSILFEAISLGKCLIVSNTKALKEICRDSVVYFKDYKDLINNITLLKDDKLRLSFENKVKELRKELAEMEERRIAFLKKLLRLG
jgi:Glycosyl transferases group 1.